MIEQLRRAAERTQYAARLLALCGNLFGSAISIWFGLWLAVPFNSTAWNIPGFAIVILGGGGFLVRAAQIFLETHPQQRPDERERYLQSRGLFIPGRIEAERRRKHHNQ